jgi:hypothetical protein
VRQLHLVTSLVKKLLLMPKRPLPMVKLLPLMVKQLQLMVKKLQLMVKKLQLMVKKLQLMVKKLPLMVKKLQLMVKQLQLMVKMLQLMVKQLPLMVKKLPLMVKKLPLMIKKLQLMVKKLPLMVKKLLPIVKNWRFLENQLLLETTLLQLTKFIVASMTEIKLAVRMRRLLQPNNAATLRWLLHLTSRRLPPSLQLLPSRQEAPRSTPLLSSRAVASCLTTHPPKLRDTVLLATVG